MTDKLRWFVISSLDNPYYECRGEDDVVMLLHILGNPWVATGVDSCLRAQAWCHPEASRVLPDHGFTIDYAWAKKLGFEVGDD